VGENFGTVEHCAASVTVNGFNHLGGLMGINVGLVRNCFASGNVSGNENPGGLVGVNFGTIENSYAIGNVSTSFGWYPGYPRGAGGLVGANEVAENSPATIRNSFSTGNVSGPAGAALGGLVGVNLLYSGTHSCPN